ncbi:hypothetical protein BKA70DRAFT_1105502, partial [Coprinopsis sp. MPI-PUGE-AT-0042]
MLKCILNTAKQYPQHLQTILKHFLSWLSAPQQKRHIFGKQHRYHGRTFEQIGNELKIDCTVVSRNYRKLERQGSNPDFYAKAPKPGRPRLISPRDERLAERMITSSRVSDATNVKRKLFPHISASTVRRMFSRIGMHGRIRWKKPFLSRAH